LSSDKSHSHVLSLKRLADTSERARGPFTHKLSLSLAITFTVFTGDEARHPRPGQAPLFLDLPLPFLLLLTCTVDEVFQGLDNFE
jgi:hypothetical protein